MDSKGIKMSDKVINYFTWLIMLGMLGYFAYSQGWIFSHFQNLSSKEGYALMAKDKNLIIIDVRSSKEYTKDSIVGSINIPFSEMEENLSRVTLFKNKNILLYSERGKRSIDASHLLSKEGFKVLNLNGGVVFWIRNGYTLRKP